MYKQIKKTFLKQVTVIFLAIILLTTSVVSFASDGYNLTVETDQPYYYPGEQVNISGQLTLNGSGILGSVCPVVKDPNNVTISGGLCLSTDPEGYYVFSFILEPDAILGIYNVTVTCHINEEDEIVVYTTFEVVSTTVEVEAYDPYEGTVGELVSFYGNATYALPTSFNRIIK